MYCIDPVADKLVNTCKKNTRNNLENVRVIHKKKCTVDISENLKPWEFKLKPFLI